MPKIIKPRVSASRRSRSRLITTGAPIAAAGVIVLVANLPYPARSSEAQKDAQKVSPAASTTKNQKNGILDQIGKFGANSVGNMHVVAGMALMEQKKYQAALKEFDSAIALCPDAGKFYKFRAECYFSLEEYDKCMNDAKRALEQVPEDAQCCILLARVYLKRDDASKAEALLNTASRLEPRNVRILILQSSCQLLKNEPDKAMAYANRAMEIDPVFSKLYFDAIASSVHLSKGENESAIKSFDEVLKVKPTAVNAIMLRAEAKARLKQREEAIKDFDQAIALEPKRDDAYAKKAQVLYEAKKYDLSIKCLDTAIGLNKRQFEYFDLRARAYMAQNNFAEAIRNFDSAIALNDKSPDIHRYRGYCYERNAQPKEAMNDYKKALSLAPKDKESEENLKRVEAIINAKTTDGVGKTQSLPAKIQPRLSSTPAATTVKAAQSSLLPTKPAVEETQRPAAAHTVQTFSGSRLITKEFDKDGLPIGPVQETPPVGAPESNVQTAGTGL